MSQVVQTDVRQVVSGQEPLKFLLGTIWYSMLYGKGFYALIVPRLTANLIKIPVETIVLSIFLPVLIAVMRRAKVRI